MRQTILVFELPRLVPSTMTDADSVLVPRAALGALREAFAFLSRKPAVVCKMMVVEIALQLGQDFLSVQSRALVQQFQVNAQPITTGAECAFVHQEPLYVQPLTLAYLFLLCYVALKATTAEIAQQLRPDSRFVQQLGLVWPFQLLAQQTTTVAEIAFVPTEVLGVQHEELVFLSLYHSVVLKVTTAEIVRQCEQVSRFVRQPEIVQ